MIFFLCGFGGLNSIGAAALTGAAAKDIDDFRYFPALVLLVAAGDGVFNAMAHVIPQDFLFGAAKRRPHSGHLGHDINAVTVLLNHADQAPDLSFDAVEPFQDGGLCF
jgi:hypothetical protein